jgi:WD40 repeat protein
VFFFGQFLFHTSFNYISPMVDNDLLYSSAAQIDFGLWNPEQKQVSKEKVGSKILSVAWSPDGLTLAIGMQSGVISLRNQQGEETYRMERRAPIFCMVFIPGVGGMGGSKTAAGAGASPTPGGSMDGDVLAVGCWDKTLSMYR